MSRIKIIQIYKPLVLEQGENTISMPTCNLNYKCRFNYA